MRKVEKYYEEGEEIFEVAGKEILSGRPREILRCGTRRSINKEILATCESIFYCTCTKSSSLMHRHTLNFICEEAIGFEEN